MPRLIYVGPFDAVETEDGQTVARGKSAEFAADLAERLLEQADNWHKAAAAKKKGDA